MTKEEKVIERLREIAPYRDQAICAWVDLLIRAAQEVKESVQEGQRCVISNLQLKVNEIERELARREMVMAIVAEVEK